MKAISDFGRSLFDVPEEILGDYTREVQYKWSSVTYWDAIYQMERDVNAHRGIGPSIPIERYLDIMNYAYQLRRDMFNFLGGQGVSYPEIFELRRMMDNCSSYLKEHIHDYA